MLREAQRFGNVHVAHNSGDNEWHTPAAIIADARQRCAADGPGRTKGPAMRPGPWWWRSPYCLLSGISSKAHPIMNRTK